MRYYTKEWYDLMQKQDYTLCMKKIPDKKYTDKDIKELYNKELKKWVSQAKREYNQPPFEFDMDIEEMLNDGELDLDDIIMVDQAANTCRKPVSIEEVLEQTREENRQRLEEFENRPPFDEEEVKREFYDMYKNKQRALYFPKWVLESVDKRLLALDLLPESTYNRLRAEEKEVKKQFKAIERAADKAARKEAQRVPERILEAFCFHDAAVLSLKMHKNNMVMELKLGGVAFEDETTYRRVIFYNAEVIENEVKNSIRREKEILPSEDENEINESTEWSNCWYLYDEIYALDDERYEEHMMMDVNGLRYVTVRCSDVSVEEMFIY